MRKVLLVVVMLVAVNAQAQTWDEWFRQKKTQIRYLMQQIAGLQVYIELGQEGYGIARDGLQVISDIKNGEFNLHNGYFHSLSEVKPSIKGYSKVVESIVLDVKIRQQISATRKLVNSASLHAGHVEYVTRVLSKLLDEVQLNKKELDDVITEGRYSLTDDERLSRIEALYQGYSNQYTFSKAFCQAVLTIVVDRQLELDDGRAIQKMYDFQIP